VGYVERTGKMRNEYKILDGKPERERSMRITRCTWNDNIKMNLEEVGCGPGSE